MNNRVWSPPYNSGAFYANTQEGAQDSPPPARQYVWASRRQGRYSAGSLRRRSWVDGQLLHALTERDVK